MSVTTACSDSPSSVRWHPVVVLVLLAIGALNLIKIATPWGIGASPDSVAYIHQARALSEGGSVFGMGTQWPPLYPMLLGGTALFSGDPYAGARWLHALLFCANVALFGLLLLRTIRSRWIALGGVLLLIGATPILTVHAFAWSEPAFLLLVMMSLGLLAGYLTRPRPVGLALAAFLTGLACLTRYAGLPLVAVGATLLLFRRGPGFRGRLAEVALFVGVALVLPAVWLAGVLAAGGSASRALAFHPLGLTQLWQAVFTVTGWLHVPAATPGAVRLLLVALLLLAGGAVLFWSRRALVAVTWQAAFVRLLLLFVLFYLGFLALSISFLDANTPLDDRILAPVYVAGLFLAIAGAGRLLQMLSKRPLMRPVITAALGLFLVVQLATAASWLREQRSKGLGYSSPLWLQSATLEAVRVLPADVDIFSNAPEAIDLLASREALSLPRKNAAMLGERNAGYEDDIAALQRALEAGAALVYFDTVANRPVVSPAELEQRMSLIAAERLPDGALYVAGPQE